MASESEGAASTPQPAEPASPPPAPAPAPEGGDWVPNQTLIRSSEPPSHRFGTVFLIERGRSTDRE
jgi:hypothetical protein